MIQGNTFMPNMSGPNQVDTLLLTAGVAALQIAVTPGTVIRVVNTHATQAVYLDFGNAAATTATTSDMPVLALQTAMFVVPNNCFFLAYIASGAATPVYVTRGI